MSLKNKSDELKEKAKELEKEAALIKELKEKFPDLEEYSNRWNHVHYCSKMIIPKCDKFNMTHSCGCCYDSMLYVKPYIKYKDIKIHSDPVEITVGNQSNYDGVDNEWHDDWEKKLIDLGFSDGLINAVRNRADKDKKSLELWHEYQAKLDALDDE